MEGAKEMAPDTPESSANTKLVSTTKRRPGKESCTPDVKLDPDDSKSANNATTKRRSGKEICKPDVDLKHDTPESSANAKLVCTNKRGMCNQGCKPGDSSKHDADLLKSFDTDFKARKQALISTMSSTGTLPMDSLKQATKYVRDCNGKTVEAIFECKKCICEENAKLKMRNAYGYNLLVKEYLNNSSEMLHFFSDLRKFVTSARDSHSYIEDLIEQFEMDNARSESNLRESIPNARHTRLMMVAEQLQNLKASNVYDQSSTQGLLQSIERLLIKHYEMLESLQKEKLGEKYWSIRGWKKVADVVVTVVLFVSAVVATRLVAVPPSVLSFVDKFCPILRTGYDLIVSWVEEYEDSIKAETGMKKPIQVGTFLAMEELDGMKDSINSVENEIDSLLRKVKFQTEGASCKAINGIKETLSKFQQKLVELEDEIKICSAEIVKARWKVMESDEF